MSMFDKTWVGIGLKSGGMLGVGGVESVAGKFFTLTNHTWRCGFEMTSSRWGLGLGGGGGLVVLLLFNSMSPMNINGKVIKDWNLNVTMGKKLDGIAELASTVRKIGPALRGLVANLENLKDTVSKVKQQLDRYENSQERYPLYCWDVPGADLGLEISAYKTKGTLWIKDLEGS